MGGDSCCFLIRPKTEEDKINEDINRQLHKDRKLLRRECRILLLGCGGAGKSTFIKQMRVIHSEGFSKEERIRYKKNIADNIKDSIIALLDNKVGEFDTKEEEDSAIRCRYIDDMNDVIDLLQDIDIVWKSAPIQKAYGMRNRFQLPESCKYFMNRKEVIMAPDYIPKNNDIFNIRVRTTGIIENFFDVTINGVPSRLTFIDVGGQRNERRKWIHIFDNVMLILFITAISEYDETLEEDPSMNRIRESLNLFSTILRYRWFSEKGIILFLNKKDVFKEKVESGSNVVDYFPEFKGEVKNVKPAMEFFHRKYLDLNPDPKARTIYVHKTQATDTKNMSVIDSVIHDIIMQKILNEAHLN
ncbi:guanine nucleotide-binding protein G(q) subunit alpha [Lepeophtheirus salmonis]|uniref:Guanine nucleotide-binding protein Gq subunit alpha n=1 Tax=Lepeophtheirus salmonis TaxID=72036 RepID=D3PJW5_LEPSM|nr:guanine nucleotide-binding protein G(q) subunit alpha-like [Lepeophtheirus salmonis]XP_040579740.1 guanine nucleotide-binding protein G(q) subunit alpha-like [Lepeophtheirus salmonis]XP_040579741.1 guanine nucleotide-binding protein G(q) subunit alpha-like [Lepeophtheirus salmonis]ADD38851.1 Guanine nucleotide-binding protein Gq subunit alpha [Lepeophtheirus salmonis]